ncbi:hypothetical protein HBI68_195730 [Parastagonospora nodorum]|nr:hypothetical protein HBH51_191040 [Parastagonospora nodorum]KAH4050060.1 hypothetical protein HBH49_141540 [Parastagonospora nodorum]KAH4983442.1 hypothetical protein HBI76_151040 [Parastagonospora nodorum]KAH5172528.1 hypothetical protein HBH77_218670 [Parastagonospora nodorum]KAH5538856.1 hypothetical protein HBI27_119370 [Parastagonospora nodorum]
MDTERPPLLWTPEIALRSKQQVVEEDWKAPDQEAAWLKSHERRSAPAPANLKEWTTLKSHDVTLLYQARSTPPIPSLEEILGTTEKNCLNTKIGLHKVCRIGDTVVKCSTSPDVVEEAENLLFLAQNRPDLHIPTVLAVWSIPGEFRVVYCFMMNFIEGIMMSDEKFAELPIHAQDTICAKISSQIRYLRELPSEEGYYGRAHGQGWLCAPPGLETNTSASRAVVGPYKTYEEYCAAMYRALQLQRAIGSAGIEWAPNQPRSLAEFTSVFPGWEPHEPKYTWIDPSIRNIIARQTKTKEYDGIEDWEVFLIDWEYSGWYPAWLQGMQINRRGSIVLHDPDNLEKVNLYRKSELVPIMLKEFDPEPDKERLAILGRLQWRFF